MDGAVVLAVTDIAGYLTARGVTTPILPGPWIPDDLAARLVVLTWTGGGPSTNDQLFDVYAFQARCRGIERDYADAERLAGQVDAALVNYSPPLTIAGRAIKWIGRLSGPPATFARDTAGRTQFVCTYLIHAAR